MLLFGIKKIKKKEAQCVDVSDNFVRILISTDKEVKNSLIDIIKHAGVITALYTVMQCPDAVTIMVTAY